MKTAAQAMVFVLLLPSAAGAHRLDEYLQAARLVASPNDVIVEIDLTPGVSVARTVAGLIDRDRDGAISPTESEAYGRAVLAGLELSVDGSAVPLILTRVESPTIDEMLDGVGTIRLTTWARLSAARSLRMHLRFANHHAAAHSVYLVNALKSDGRLILERQSRDTHQQAIELEYVVNGGRSGAVGWSLLGAGLVLGLVWLRT
jgi:hypothetical protein